MRLVLITNERGRKLVVNRELVESVEDLTSGDDQMTRINLTNSSVLTKLSFEKVCEVLTIDVSEYVLPPL